MTREYIGCILVLVYYYTLSDIECSKTLEALREKKVTRHKREDGGQLPPLPVRHSEGDQGEQKIPDFEPETQHFDLEIDPNIPPSRDTSGSSRTKTDIQNNGPNRNTNNDYQSYSRGSYQSNTPLSDNRVQYQYYPSGSESRYSREVYPQYTSSGSQGQYYSNDANYYTSDPNNPQYNYNNQNSRTVYPNRRAQQYYPDDLRYTSGYQYRYRPTPQVSRQPTYNPQNSYVTRRPTYNQRTSQPSYNQNVPSYGSTSSNIPNIVITSNDPNCPSGDTYTLINGLPCEDAVDRIGHFICYQYERVSAQCCRKCLSVKRSENRDCEYGDRSYQCRNIQPFDCYDNRTRNICCERCRNYRSQMNTGISQCSYGDLTPRCTFVNRERHLCYLPENQRLCCITCPELADQSKPSCNWGDQNPRMCRHYSQIKRINCYLQTVQQVCCDTCESLKSRYRNAPAGCEYGDRPVTISTSSGVFDCANYIRSFGLEVCDSADINRHCCYTCYRYRKMVQRRSGG